MSHDSRPDYLDAADLAALALALAPLPLAPDRRAALRQRVLARAAAAAAPMHVVRAAEGAWLPLLPGVSIKFLQVDAQAAVHSSLWRLDPGAGLPAHGHHAEEECLVLDGTVHYAGTDYGRGDFLLARAGRPHAAFHSQGGALLYIRGELSAPLAALARRAGWGV